MIADFSTRSNLAEIIERRAIEQPDKVYLWIEDEPHTYADLRRRSRLVAHALRSLGVEEGEVVATFTATCFDAIATFFGTMQAGALMMCVNSAYKGTYLQHQLNDAKTRILLVDEDLLARVESVVPDLPELRTILVRGTAPFAPRKLHHVDVLHADVLQQGDPDRPIEATPIPWNKPAAIFYTSGTTGPSKGALIPQSYILELAKAYLKNFDFRRDDVQYAACPLFHMSGAFSTVMVTLLGGHSSVLDRQFSVSACWDRVRKYNATVFYGVGVMIAMLWNLPPDPRDADLPIRTIIGAPIPEGAWEAIEERYDCEIVSGFGQTEACMITSFVVGQPKVIGSCGKEIELFDVRIFDDDDDEVPPGVAGEIVFRPRGNNVMFQGYVGRPADTLSQLQNLWFHTGDIGRMDAEGNMYFLDRKKDYLRCRGENISSIEVESIVSKYPDVLECAAHAVPSDLGEDDLMVTVVTDAGANFDYRKLMDYCVSTMPRYAVPRYLETVAELPKTPTGKVQKHLLRARGATSTTWDRVAEGYVVPR
jgi:crotonobetaine/carnitine-CoA ligase